MAAIPSWISEQSDFSNSEPLCCSDASHQVSVQSDMVLEEMLFEEFQDGCHIRTDRFSNSESLCHCDASHQVSDQSDLWFGRRCCLKNFKMVFLDIGTKSFQQF